MNKITVLGLALLLCACTKQDEQISLGRSDTTPDVARLARKEALEAQLTDAKRQETIANTRVRNGGGADAQAAAKRAHERQLALRQAMRDNELGEP
jgi:hypothetical protein